MRLIVTLLAIIVVIGIVAVATGFVNLHSQPGSLPSVAVSGGTLPKVSANVGTIDIGSRNEAVSVPKVDVGSTEKQVAVPTVQVNKPQ
jgi:hypothetical protein